MIIQIADEPNIAKVHVESSSTGLRLCSLFILASLIMRSDFSPKSAQKVTSADFTNADFFFFFTPNTTIYKPYAVTLDVFNAANDF